MTGSSTIKRRIWFLALVSVIGNSLCLAPPSSQASLMTFTNEATFLAATSATAEPAIPNSGLVPTPQTLGNLTFNLGPEATALFFGTSGQSPPAPGDWSSLIPGNDIAVSGVENLNIDLAVRMVAFGFQIHEPAANNQRVTDGCFVAPDPCTDSTFQVSLFDGATLLGAPTFNAPDDVLSFFGVFTDASMAFNRIEILETNNTIDDEFFGQFYTRRLPTANAPEPSTLALLSFGIFGVAYARRRRLQSGL